MTTTCPFCHPTEDLTPRRLHSNELAQALLTNIPVVPGHTLLLPNRCVATFAELTPAETSALFTLLEQTKQALQKTFAAEGFNLAWNEGAVAGQSVPHFHLHVLPRKAGDTGVHNYDPRQFLYRPGPRDVTPTPQLAPLATQIRTNLPPT